MSAGQYSVPFSRSRADAIYTDAMARMYGLVAVGIMFTAAGVWVGDQLDVSSIVFGSGWIGMLLVFGVLFGMIWAANSVVMAGHIALGSTIYLAFTAVEGLIISYILVAYTTGTIAAAFLSTACLFIAMCVIGMTTKKDISRLGPMLVIGLIGAIIVSLVNAFLLQSSMLHLVINLVLIPIFLGLTVWQTKQMKELAQQAAMRGDQKTAAQAAVIGSIGLYLNALNLFLIILSLLRR